MREKYSYLSSLKEKGLITTGQVKELLIKKTEEDERKGLKKEEKKEGKIEVDLDKLMKSLSNNPEELQKVLKTEFLKKSEGNVDVSFQQGGKKELNVGEEDKSVLLFNSDAFVSDSSFSLALELKLIRLVTNLAKALTVGQLLGWTIIIIILFCFL
jgi:hypothetical protein